MQSVGQDGNYLPQSNLFTNSHVDPLLECVSQVILANGMGQSSERWLEFCDGRRQVFERAAQPDFFVQNCGSFTLENCVVKERNQDR